MGKKAGARGSNDGNLRNRIEGFGNSPMPPPVPDTFEDRLHSALSHDETIGDWYNSARASVDAMVTAFDDTVNAIADTIEDTVAAVVGDDDVFDPEPQNQAKNKRGDKGERKPKPEKDDGDRSGVKWDEVVPKICDEGDLDNFVLQVRTQPVNMAEEREVAGLLSEQLLQAEKPSQTLRVLYVMQSIEEGDLPVVIDVIREKCQAKLEKLKNQTFFKTLATQVLGDGPAPKTEEQKKDEEKAQRKKEKKEKKEQAAAAASSTAASTAQPFDLLDVQDSAKPAKTSDPMDLLDSSPAPAAGPAPKIDLLDMSTPASAQPPRDLLSLEVTPMLQPTPPPAPVAAATSQASPGFAAFPAVPPPPQNNNSQFANFTMGGGNTGMSKPPQAGFPSQQPFGASPAMGSMSGSGYQQGYQQAINCFSSAPAPPASAPLSLMSANDNFDPNPKPSVPAGGGMKYVNTGPPSHSSNPSDPFSSLGAMGGFGNGSSMSQGQKGATGNSGGAFGAGRSGTTGTGKSDALGLDDVLNAELAKMNLVH